MPKTAKRSTNPATPTNADEHKAKAEAAGKKAGALIIKLLKSTPAEQAAAAKQKAERDAADRAKREKKRKALQVSAERHNQLCGGSAEDTLNNCRQVLQFLRTTTTGIEGMESLSPDESMGFFLIYGTLIDALRRQERAL